MSKRRTESDRLLHIATLGRTIGLDGAMKLHLYTDFPEQFHDGVTFWTNDRTPITLEAIDRDLVWLEGVDSPEAAKRFTNAMLYTTYSRTREEITLEPGEYFWFDIVGCRIVEGGQTLGKVLEVERIIETDYLQVQTDKALGKRAKQFLIPYHPPFIVAVDIEEGTITTDGALDLLEAS